MEEILNQLLTMLWAILLGVGGMMAYYFGSNYLIDRVFADEPPSFSTADFISLVSAVLILIAFTVLPWVAVTPPEAEMSDTVMSVTYSGSNVLSAQLIEDEGIVQFGLILVPVAAVIGALFALWGLFEASARGSSAVGTLIAGILGLGYFTLYFILNGQNKVDLTPSLGAGFWVAFFASFALLLQVTITRPVYTPPASQMAMKVNTDTRIRIRPWFFVAPALLALTIYLVWPAVNTFLLSFWDRTTENYIGLDNYRWAFTNETMLTAFGNNLLWLLVVPASCVAIGLGVAVLSDRVRWESTAKAFIFLPMAISFVGASVVWRFVYAFAPPGRPQIGILNAIRTTFGHDPIGWFIEKPGNNFALMIILIWIQAGFAMVLLSAALKGVPEETLEAARIDGANEFQIFLRVIIPQVMSTITVVYTTIVIVTLKIFDIVFVMTSGQFDTEVLANRMYREMFRFGNFGRGSMIAVILMVAVLPVMYFNIKRFREQEAMR